MKIEFRLPSLGADMESATLTESLVKVAGEAFEPISTRASLNVERFNELVA